MCVPRVVVVAHAAAEAAARGGTSEEREARRLAEEWLSGRFDELYARAAALVERAEAEHGDVLTFRSAPCKPWLRELAQPTTVRLRRSSAQAASLDRGSQAASFDRGSKTASSDRGRASRASSRSKPNSKDERFARPPPRSASATK